LKDVPPQDRPPLLNVFFAFRAMLAVGFFMIAAALYGAFLMWRGHLFDTRWFLHIVAHTWWVGFVGVLAGWITTESGRQPWVVYGVLRTADAVSPVPGSSVAVTLALFVVVYGIVFAMGIYYINRLIERGLQPATPQRLPVRSPIAAAAGDDAFQKGG
jgi:cytochrome bd ubiquinol oxidase subunit I